MAEVKVTMTLKDLRDLMMSAGDCGAYEGSYWNNAEGYEGPYGNDQVGALVEQSLEDGIVRITE